MAEIEGLFDFLSDIGVDGHTISPGYEYDAAKADMVKRLNLQPEDFFLTREGTRDKFADLIEWTKTLPDPRHADLPRVPRGQARTGMLRLGDPHAQHRGLAGAVLFHGRRRSFPDLRGHAHKGGLEQVRRGQGHRRSARPALRELHDAVRLRAERRAGHQRRSGAIPGRISPTTSAPGPSRPGAAIWWTPTTA